MKKLFLSVAALSLLSSTSVFANDVSLGINVGGGDPPSASLVIDQPAVIVAQPQTVIVERPAGYDPFHHDHRYWAHQEQERREREHRDHERREHERHDHDDHHHDHEDHHDHYDHDDHR